MIIGVTGSYASGKDTVAELLRGMNFQQISFSDLLQEELRRRGEKITRESLLNLGNELRHQFGGDILAKMAQERVHDGENYIFTSIRTVAEAKLLEQRTDFLLIKVIAPAKMRLDRLKGRKLDTDLPEDGDVPHAQQQDLVAERAKVVLQNNSTVHALQDKVEKLVSDWMFKLQPDRPDWDHYFMNIAEQVKMRATCMSARKGSVLVRDKIILSTGYNGTPKDIDHCNAGGCPRCTLRHLGKVKSGDYSEPCLCCHAEENAIVQAAYNGASTKGAMLYTTFTPCTNCAKMIINAGITEVVAKVPYPDEVGTTMLKNAGVKLRVLS